MHHNPIAMVEEEADYLGIQQKKYLNELFDKFSNL